MGLSPTFLFHLFSSPSSLSFLKPYHVREYTDALNPQNLPQRVRDNKQLRLSEISVLKPFLAFVGCFTSL